jgi:hypothetical protein
LVSRAEGSICRYVLFALAFDRRLITLIMQLVQAAILLCWHSYITARFSTVWLDVSTAVRIATCLGLHHVRVARVNEEGKLDDNRRGFKSTSLEPTNDPEELRERALTFYAVWIGDRIASASTGELGLTALARNGFVEDRISARS